MSSNRWFYELDGQQCGPVATGELKFLAQSGTLSPTTKVREEFTSQWRLLKNAGLLQAVAKKSISEADKFSPAAQFEHWKRAPRSAEQTALNESSLDPSDQLPALPERTDEDALRRKKMIAGGSVAAFLLLLLLVWLFWPDSSPAPGLASSGDGDGAAVQGTEQSANASIDSNASTKSETAANEAAASQTAQATASGADSNSPDSSQKSASVENADSHSSDTAADAAASAGNGASSSSDTSAKANAGDEGTAEDDMVAGVEAESSENASNGLTVGDSEGESRFSVSAPGETTFFGIRGTGRRFTYVVDCSGSMQGEPLSRAKKELMASLAKLPSHVEFQIIFFDDLTYEFASEGFVIATDEAKERATSFVSGIENGGGTNVKLGMDKAFSPRKKPDTVFLLTDGSFEQDTPEFIRNLNKSRKVRINTVAFVSNTGEPLLKEIADKNRGDYRFVP